MAIELDMRSADFEQRFEALLGAKRESAVEVDAVAASISLPPIRRPFATTSTRSKRRE